MDGKGRGSAEEAEMLPQGMLVDAADGKCSRKHIDICIMTQAGVTYIMCRKCTPTSEDHR